MNTSELTTGQVAAMARVSKDTLVRWLKHGKVKEPRRDRNGYRVFTQAEADAIVRYSESTPPVETKKKLKRV